MTTAKAFEELKLNVDLITNMYKVRYGSSNKSHFKHSTSVYFNVAEFQSCTRDLSRRGKRAENGELVLSSPHEYNEAYAEVLCPQERDHLAVLLTSEIKKIAALSKVYCNMASTS